MNDDEHDREIRLRTLKERRRRLREIDEERNEVIQTIIDLEHTLSAYPQKPLLEDEPEIVGDRIDAIVDRMMALANMAGREDLYIQASKLGADFFLLWGRIVNAAKGEGI